MKQATFDISEFGASQWFLPAVSATTWTAGFALLGVITWLGWLPPVPGFCLAFIVVTALITSSAATAANASLPRKQVARLLCIGVLGSGLAWLEQVPYALSAYGGGLALLLSATAIGAALGKGIEKTSHVWPLVLVALGVDMWSVFSPEGVTHAVVSGEGPLPAYYILLTLPVPGVGISPLIGIGDLLFAGLLLGAVATLELPLRRAVVGMSAGFLACLVALLIAQTPLPALPFFGVSTAAALGRRVTPTLRELALAAGFTTLLLLLASAL